MDLALYNLYKDLVSPFDLFLWSGRGGFSDLIKNVTSSRFSHASVGVWMQPIQGLPPRLFNAESTTLNDVPDITCQEFRKGVQIVNFAQRLSGYDGDVWWYPIKDPFTEKEKLDMMVWLMARESEATPYDLKQAMEAVHNDEDTPLWARVLTSPFAVVTNGAEDFGKLFCSEMVTKLYKIGNRIPESVNASSITPNELLEFDIYKNPIKLSI